MASGSPRIPLDRLHTSHHGGLEDVVVLLRPVYRIGFDQPEALTMEEFCQILDTSAVEGRLPQRHLVLTESVLHLEAESFLSC